MRAQDRLERGHEAMCAVLRSMFREIVVLDRAEVWRVDGATSMADWLVYRFNISARTAVLWVDVSHALVRLPLIAAAFEEGRLSWDQIRWLARFATIAEDAELANSGQGMTPAQLEQMYYRRRRLTREDAQATHENRELRTRWNRRTRMFKFWGQLPEDSGALLENALQRYAESAPRHPESGERLPQHQLHADALVEIASAKAASSDPDRANIVVHVDAHALVTGDGNGELECGVQMSIDSVLRRACDARVQISVTGVGVGRVRRTVPPALSRELRQRDHCCRFPGCGRRRGLAAHHVHHWAHGGRTDPDNLALLCPYHHWLVHEGGWRMRLTSGGRVAFVRPDGRALRKLPHFAPPGRLSRGNRVVARGP